VDPRNSLRAQPTTYPVTLIARTGLGAAADHKELLELSGVSCGYIVERVTKIELALSAWEYNRSGPLTALSWAIDAPPVTVKDPAAPGLMARQWPMV
jgi:hypothetical protein